MRFWIAIACTMVIELAVLRRLRFDGWVVAIVLAATLVDASYLGYTQVYERNYDASSHLLYIDALAQHLWMPTETSCTACGHPPLYHALAALWSRGVQVGGFMPHDLGLQWLSLLLFFFAIPHTLEDFALGEPSKNGVPAPVLSLVVAGLFALQGLTLFGAGRGDRRSYFLHAALGILWPLAAGLAQVPVILASSHYRSGFISAFYVTGMILIGILLFLTSWQALRADRPTSRKK